ncbi:MAG: hypothetical protein HQ567_00150 [Candidatus Nealsonbacteria bacterium]|nr:hypothetical protein [Candidatus Nealsonbacteria bacterium]
MRLIAGLLLILLVLGWLAVTLPVAKTEPDCAEGPIDDGWRQTTDGWQHRDGWAPHHRASLPGLHPAVVGLLELQLSLAALVGLSRKPGR